MKGIIFRPKLDLGWYYFLSDCREGVARANGRVHRYELRESRLDRGRQKPRNDATDFSVVRHGKDKEKRIVDYEKEERRVLGNFLCAQ